MPPKIKPGSGEGSKKIDTYFEREQRLEARRAKKEALEAMTSKNGVGDKTGGTPVVAPGVAPGVAGEKGTIEEAFAQFTNRFVSFETELKKWQGEIKTWQTKSDEKIDKIQNEIKDDILPQLATANEWAASASGDAQFAKNEVESLSTRMENLEMAVGNWQRKYESLQNLKDREYKEKNIRVLGMAEEEGEICKKSVQKLFVKVCPDLKLDKLEFAYRIGKKDSKQTRPRPVIMRFKDKRFRNKVFREIRKKKDDLTDIKITDDLTKLDIELRNLATPQIKAAIDSGLKAFFARGTLKIDGKFTPIDGIEEWKKGKSKITQGGGDKTDNKGGAAGGSLENEDTQVTTQPAPPPPTNTTTGDKAAS